MNKMLFSVPFYQIKKYLFFCFSLLLTTIVCVEAGWGQTTVAYTIQTGNFNTLNTEKNNNPPFAGTYNNTATEIGQYANGGSFGNTPGAAVFQTFNTTGNGNTGTARTLRVGDRFTITGFVASNPSAGGYIGISFRASTTYTNFFSATDASTVARFQLDNTGNWKVYSGSTVVATSTSGANADRTFSIEITSSNTFNATIDSETFYDLSFGATGPISSFAIYTYGDANANSFWKNASLTNIGHEAGTGLRFGYDMSSGSRTISGIISDGVNTNATSGTLINKVLSGGSGNIVIFSGPNSYSGSTTVNANSRLELQNASALGNTTGVTVTSTGTLSLYNASGINYNSYSTTLNGTGQGGTGALLNTGGANTWPGTITLGSSSTINSTSTGGAGSLTLSGSVVLGANNVTFGGSNNHTTVSGGISGTGKMIKSGTNNLIFTGANSYTGNTEVDQGELWIGSGGSISSSSAIFLGNGGLADNVTKLWLSNSAGGSVFSSNLTVNSGNYARRFVGGLNTSGTHTFSGNITSTSNFLTLSAFNAGGTTSFTGVISNAASQVDIEGSGTVILGAANTYTGKTYITGSALTLAANNALPVGTNAGIIQTGAGTPTINLGLFNLGSATTAAGSAGKLDFDVNTTLNLGSSGTNLYYFKASNDQTWNAGTITINNWTGSVGLSGTGPKIFVGGDNTGLSADQLAKITFTGFTSGAVQLSTGEVVPKPITPTITSFTPTSGYVGTTITITGTNFAFINSVSIGGVAAASFTVNSTTQITAVVAAGTGTGTITITALGGTVTSASTFTIIAGYISVAPTDWNTGSTWLGGNVPPGGVSVIVDHAVTVNSAVTNSPSSITINATDALIFGSGGTITATTITNNGTIDMTSGGTLTISNGGTLTNNATFTRGTGTVSFAGTGTVTGTIAFNNVNIGGGVNFGSGSTIHGALQINPNGFVSAACPTYAANSTLIYNTGGTFALANEWSSNSLNLPYNVRVNSGTTLDMDVKKGPTGDNSHYDGEGREMLGDLELYGTLTMGSNSGTMAEDLKVGGNVTIRSSGGLILGSQKPFEAKIADIQVGLNFLIEQGGFFDASRRAVIFNGTTTTEQTFTSGNSIENFGYIIVNKPFISGVEGTVKMFCDAYIYGQNQGSILQLLNGSLDLNGKSMTLQVRDSVNSVNQNILIDGSAGNLTRRVFNSSATPSSFNITHYRINPVPAHVDTVKRNSANLSLLSFGTNVIVTVGSTTGNVGIDFGSGVTTINGTLRINRRGFVDRNPPTYATNSLLQYNIGTDYNRNAEWNAASGPGYPFNVQTSLSGTRLITGGAFNSGGTANEGVVLNMAGSLTIDAGTTFDMTNTNANNMTVPLTVGLDINNAGTLLASQEADGNIILGRNWSRTGAGIFTPYFRSVTFNTGTDATLTAPTGGETFYDLIINKPATGVMGSSYLGFRVTLNSPVQITNNINLTSGIFITTSTNIITVNDGASATGGGVESFVSGPMRKTGKTDFSFPVGDLTNVPSSGPLNASVQYHYRPIAISGLGTTSFTYTTEFHRANPYLQGAISAAARAAGLQIISYCEYWDLTRTGGPATITVTPSWSTHSVWPSNCNTPNYVLNSSALRVVPFNGIFPLPGISQWGDADFGQSGTGTGNQTYLQTISWNGAVNYNKFVLGSVNWRLAPLPAEIKIFQAISKNNNVQLNWLVNNNDQVRYYTIERSRNGIQFESLKQITARYNESTSNYSDLDQTPFNGWGYYRLRITDLSGNVSYSAVQKVWLGQITTHIRITPNPAKDQLWINLAEPEKITEISIVNGLGQLVIKQNRLMTTNQLNIAALQPGIYYVRIVGQNGITTEPFVKE